MLLPTNKMLTLDILSLLYTDMCPYYKLTRLDSAVMEPFKLDTLYPYKPIGYYNHQVITTINILNYAAVNGYLNILKWCATLKYDTSDYNLPYHLINHAIQYGHLHVLKWLLNYYRTITFNIYEVGSFATIAARNGHFKLMRWLLTELEGNTEAIIGAAEHNQLDEMKWLYERNHVRDGWIITVSLLKTIKPDIIEWLLTIEPKALNYLYTSAASGGNIESLEWLLINKPITKPDLLKYVTRHAVKHVAVLRLLDSKGLFTMCDKEVINKAIKGGDLELVTWLYTKFPYHFRHNALPAAENQPDILEWLKLQKIYGSKSKSKKEHLIV